MTRRPWHAQLAAVLPFSWWLALVFGVVMVGQAADTIVRATLGDDSVGGGDVGWAIVGLPIGAWWLAIAYARRRHRQTPSNRA